MSSKPIIRHNFSYVHYTLFSSCKFLVFDGEDIDAEWNICYFLISPFTLPYKWIKLNQIFPLNDARLTFLLPHTRLSVRLFHFPSMAYNYWGIFYMGNAGRSKIFARLSLLGEYPHLSLDDNVIKISSVVSKPIFFEALKINFYENHWKVLQVLENGHPVSVNGESKVNVFDLALFAMLKWKCHSNPILWSHICLIYCLL